MLILRNKYFSKENKRNIIDEDFLDELEEAKSHKKANYIAGGTLGTLMAAPAAALSYELAGDAAYRRALKKHGYEEAVKRGKRWGKGAAAATIAAGLGGGLYLGKYIQDQTEKDVNKTLERYKDADKEERAYLRNRYNRNIDRGRDTSNAIIAGSLAGR